MTDILDKTILIGLGLGKIYLNELASEGREEDAPYGEDKK